MNYYINPTALTGVFTVPTSVVDNYFKFSKPEHIKVLLYILRNISSTPDDALIAAECGITEYDVKEALLYWAEAGILLPQDVPVKTAVKAKKTSVRLNEKPTRQEVARRSINDPKIEYLLGEAQKRFARNLKDSESRTLVWLYDDNGVDISVILLVIQYAIAQGKGNIRYIESLALELLDKGIDNITDADAELHKKDLREKSWQAVCTAFGIEWRKPSEKESETAAMWLNDWGISRELLNAAYDECVNTKSKFIFSYTAKILENWHNKGYEKPEDIEKASENEGYASYDIDLYEKMLNGKD